MTEFNEKHTHAARGLATEKDIDPAFGLFTDEKEHDAVLSANELLEDQYPEEEAHRTADYYNGTADDVPDADVINKDSKVDPAAPDEEFHGTDLLNGVGRHPEEESD